MGKGYILFNGVHGSGGYLQEPAPFDTIAPGLASQLRKRRLVYRSLEAGRDPRDLSRAGWGVLFGPGVGDAVKEALAPLLRHRSAAATRRENLYREHVYRPGTSKAKFLHAQGAFPGPVDPRRVPYYLLLVGDPQEIPFSFQHQLGVQYAVGRLCFETPEEYARYATTVVELETQSEARPREAVFFGPWRDPTTRLCAERLVRPLCGELADNGFGWKTRYRIGDYAHKGSLANLLGGPETPGLLFTASHGLGLWNDDPRQRSLQGSLLCQDWPGPGNGIELNHIFNAEDVPDDASVRGLVSFHFACYSAGTPQWDDFSHHLNGERKLAAPEGFVARLPQRLLGHPKGSALAVIGHIERAWLSSFLWEGQGPNLSTFKSALLRLMEGYPVGAAMEFFGSRFAEIATEITADREAVSDEPAGDDELATLWMAHNDARNYVVLGDPAVRIPGTSASPYISPGPVWRG